MEFGGGTGGRASAAPASIATLRQSGSASAAVSNQGEPARAGPPATAGAAELLSLRFQGIGQDGTPLARRPYTITRAGGAEHAGVTDVQGFTEPIEAIDPEQVAVHFMFVDVDGNTIDRKDLLP